MEDEFNELKALLASMSKIVIKFTCAYILDVPSIHVFCRCAAVLKIEFG